MFKVLRRIIGNKIILLGLLPSMILLCDSHAADAVKDPMQPPAYALNKIRMAKLKNANSQAGSKTTKKAVNNRLELSSILIAEDRKIAVINDQMLTIGEKINGASLIKISKYHVHLIKKGKRIELKLDETVSAIRKKAVEGKL